MSVGSVAAAIMEFGAGRSIVLTSSKILRIGSVFYGCQ